MTKTEEKIELLNSMGYTQVAYNIQLKERAKETVKELTDLRFKIITRKEIDKKINRYYFDQAEINPIILFSLLAIFPFCAIGSFSTTTSIICLLLGFSIVAASCFLGLWHKSVTRWVDLAHWKNNIPYGAVLAVKEARDKGLDSFCIYFPVTNAVEKRLLSDPVITAQKNEVEVEIFAWDDGKIYE